jgi:predicted dehydrogenase
MSTVSTPTSTPEPASEPLRLALIGAGTFARDAYLPSLAPHPDQLRVTAVYSRTLAHAAALTEQIAYPVDATDDLAALLSRPDVEAVAVLLPIAAMPAIIRAALAAGKHVLSEKPLAPDVATGRDLLAHYRAAQQTHHPGLVWMVGENWRYEEAFVRAADLVHSGIIGDPLTCSWAIYAPITERNKYYHSSWRRDSSFPGGFPLDTGVHHVAVLRMILGEIAQVSAVARQVSPDLPPVDTLAATLQFDSGAVGTYLASYVVGAPWPPQLHIVGTRGSLRVQRKAIETTVDGTTEQINCSGFDGVEKELLAFARAIRQTEPHLSPPEQALQDLAVMEAILAAAEQGERVAPQRVI